MESKELKIARLRELIKIAKVKGYAKTHEDFAAFIGLTRRTVQYAIVGKNTENIIALAEDALEREGVHVKNIDTVEQRLLELEQKMFQLEEELRLIRSQKKGSPKKN